MRRHRPPGSGDTDADHVCVVAIVFTNEGDRPRPFPGTADEQDPTLIFEVPAGIHLRRVPVGQGMAGLAGG
ncbi:hypothetical protein ACNTMW_01935 [Planosporangium sp. 12N6]|uniref:hypothetical protein n=1 Tax=Planosporangium spinosum TaxID=3402278 RepID=UPI003CEB260C